MTRQNYVVITPVRNEETNLPHTIAAMISQTVPPQRWVIVNDGSSDATRQIADEAAGRCSWIHVIHRADRGYRKPGSGVMEAFRDGYAMVEDLAWDYLVKLDGDLSFDAHFFEQALDRFVEDPNLGIGGGTICQQENGQLLPEWRDPAFHVRGATKIYRSACWRQLGSLYPVPGWDTLDEIKANMLGWTTYSFAEQKLLHHRRAGEADGSWKNWVKNGRANYISGYLPLFMLLKCAARTVRKPYVVAALGLLWGFFGGYLKRTAQIDDRKLTRYLRQEQMNFLLRRKSLWSRPSQTGGFQEAN